MSDLEKFHIDVFKLSNSTHEYDFEFNDNFFKEFEESEIERGKGEIQVSLLKNESFIKMTMRIDGSVELICDRSLDEFKFPLSLNKEVIFKYGEEEQELDDEIVIITRDTQRIQLAQYVYEFIGLAIPMKKLHPRFENDDNEDELVYSDENANSDDEKESTDPRWAALKKLK